MQMNSNHILKIPNFLPKDEHDLLLNTICANQQAFEYLEVPNENSGGTLHLSLGPETPDSSEVTAIRKVCESLSKRIQQLLPEIFNSLEIEPFPVSKIPLTLMNGLNGHTGSVHNDESGGRFKISLLYYFNSIPKVFQGGALDLFETDENEPNGYKEEPFTTIEHQDNLLIAFRSETYHGVTDVTMDSKEFKDGRFVIVAFLGW